MWLSRDAAYALHAAALVAAQGGDRAIPAHAIARPLGIPGSTFLRVLKPLVSAGVLSPVKGPHGGFRLARPASDITVLEVVEAVDGPLAGCGPESERAAP